MKLYEDQDVAPRLSIQPGSESNRSEALDLWRKWEWKNLSGSHCKPPNQFILIVSVEDTGPGIPCHMEPRLFQPFSQADSNSSREHGGTGIGLFISQKLIKLMNGTIRVMSEPGKGSVFEFTLPASFADTAGGSKPQLPMEDKRLKGLHVALVDTDLVHREITASFLRYSGMHVELADDVQSTMEILQRTGGPTLQAVMVDIKGLPSAPAVELARSIRSTPSLKALSVLVLTSNPVSPPGEKELKDAGVSFIISKSLRLSTGSSVLLEAMGLKPQAPVKKKANDNVKLLLGKRLLVVDDNMVNQRVATSMLKRYGAIVSSVNSGIEDKKLDLVLMDIQMSEMDGWQATRHIRNWEVENCDTCCKSNVNWCRHNRLPIVAVTADAMKGTHAECFSSGMDDYITKPLDQKQLQSLLERFIKRDLVNVPPMTDVGS